MKIDRENIEVSFIQDNGVISKESRYEILDKKCLSSSYIAYIPWVLNGTCECWNCKIKIRQHRYHKGAFWWDTSYYDYVYDVLEVINKKDFLLS